MKLESAQTFAYFDGFSIKKKKKCWIFYYCFSAYLFIFYTLRRIVDSNKRKTGRFMYFLHSFVIYMYFIGFFVRFFLTLLIFYYYYYFFKMTFFARFDDSVCSESPGLAL